MLTLKQANKKLKEDGIYSITDPKYGVYFVNTPYPMFWDEAMSWMYCCQEGKSFEEWLRFDYKDEIMEPNMMTMDYRWYGMMIGPEYPTVIFQVTSDERGLAFIFWHKPQNLFTTVCLTLPRLSSVYLNETVHSWAFWRRINNQF